MEKDREVAPPPGGMCGRGNYCICTQSNTVPTVKNYLAHNYLIKVEKHLIRGMKDWVVGKTFSKLWQ